MDPNLISETLAKSSAVQKLLPEVYDDVAKPAASETGKLVATIPKAINAALVDLRIWSEEREYKFKEAQKILEYKLSHVEPEKIISPEPYIAIPAIQALSYSQESELLRNMYGTLLSNAMNIDTKDTVHPAFVEIIKQLSPLDCIVMESITFHSIVPAIDLYIYQKSTAISLIEKSLQSIMNIVVVDLFLQESFKNDLDKCKRICSSIQNLSRLGLVQKNQGKIVSFDYDKFYKSDYFESLQSHLKLESSKPDGTIEPSYYYYNCTQFGIDFANACIASYGSGILIRQSVQNHF